MNNESLKLKIELITKNLKKLETFFPNSFVTFEGDELTQAAIERYFQLVVDSIVDCNQIIIEDEGLDVSETYFKTFESLLGKSIFPDDLLIKIASSVGLRNTLVHRYENIQLKREFDDIGKFIPLFKVYLGVISKKYL